ncbi:MAG: hypothetical protein PHP42_07490 [Bacteroidota bacterium]|nr:hypothetical protein [Bacteroidota bacterium]
MKKVLMIALSVFLFSVAGAQERSDSDTKRDFEKGFKSLMKDLRSVDSKEKLEQLSKSADDFENQFKGSRDLLNNAIYPDGYDGTIEKLHEQLKAAKDLAESQIRIAQLEEQVKALSGQVETLTNENASLLAQLKGLKSELDSLRKVVALLHENIAKRDAAVFALVDSLFVQYDKQQLSTGDMKRLSSLEKNNVLTNIKRSIKDNLDFLSSTALSGLDFPKLLDEQRKFESSWKGVGKKLADAYLSSKDRTRELNQVDGMIASWHSQVDTAFWKSLNGIFVDEKVNVAPFTNGEEFYNNVVRFVDDETNNTANKDEAQRLATYEAFAYRVWGSKIKPIWVPVMKRYGMLTDAQVTDIDTKTQLWYSKVKPSNTLMYVLGAALIIAVLVGLYLGMKKRPTPAA